MPINVAAGLRLCRSLLHVTGNPCDKSFASVVLLSAHKKSDDHQYRYACDQCDKYAPRIGALRIGLTAAAGGGGGVRRRRSVSLLLLHHPPRGLLDARDIMLIGWGCFDLF